MAPARQRQRPRRDPNDRPRVLACRSYPRYTLHKLSRVKLIAADPRDPQRTPFRVQWEIRRKFTGRYGGYAIPLTPFPSRNRWGRWDLKVKMGSRNVFYHRAIAFSLWPCTTAADAEGAEVEPYWVDPAWEGWWEVHHWDGDTHNNLADNLYPMWWAHHRRLTR